MFVCAYPRVIKFGQCCDGKLNEKDCFRFDLSLMKPFYTFMINVLEIMRGNANFEEKIEKIADFSNQSYFWKMSNPDYLSLIIKENDQILLQINFDYIQFNEFLYTIYQTLILSIGYEDCDCEFIHFVLSNEIDIIKMTKIENFKQILQNSAFETNIFKYFTFFNFYLEIFFILFKLKKFCNLHFLPNNIETILQI